jgi:TRAP-type C4-dicarboxylate transport system substrate-binding protein
MMKNHLFRQLVGVCVALMLVVSLAALCQAAPKEVILKAVTAWPKGSADNKTLTIFTEEVEKLVAKKCPGELKINLVGGPEAVKTMDQVQSAQKGMVDLVHTTNAYYVSVLPEADAMKLSDFMPWEERANGAWAYYNELHEKRLGLHFLSNLNMGIKFQLYLLKPIDKADLKGLNIRVSPMYLQLVKGLGGNPVVIPPPDIYTALERKVVDGYGWLSVGIMDYGWEKVTKYFVDPTFYVGVHPILVNLQTWQKLAPKYKDLLTEAAKEAEKKVVPYYLEMEKGERAKLVAAGLQMINLPPAEKEHFLKVAHEEAWKDIIEKCPQTGPELKKLLTKK